MQSDFFGAVENIEGWADDEILGVLEGIGLDYLRILTYQHTEAAHHEVMEWLKSEAGDVWLSYFNIRESEDLIAEIDKRGRLTMIPTKAKTRRVPSIQDLPLFSNSQ